MTRVQFAKRIEAAALRRARRAGRANKSPTQGGPRHSRAKVWYSITCPKCGTDTWGDGKGPAKGIRLGSNHRRFVCPHCHTEVSLW